MKFRGGGVRVRDAKISRQPSVGPCSEWRLTRGNTRNKFRNSTAIPPDASYENFRIFFGARGAPSLLFRSLSTSPLAGISKNSSRRDLFLGYYQTFRKFPSTVIVRGMKSNDNREYRRKLSLLIRKANTCIRLFISFVVLKIVVDIFRCRKLSLLLREFESLEI